MIFWAPLLLGAQIAVQLEEAAEVDASTANQLIAAIAQAVDARTHRTVTIDDRAGCDALEGCIGPGIDEVLSVRVIAGIRKLHLVARRLPPPIAGVAIAEAELDPDPATWAEPIKVLVEALYVEGVAPKPPEIPPAPVESSTNVAPLAVLGVAAAALVVGLVFGQSSAAAKSDLEARPWLEPEYRDLDDRVEAHGIAANVLFVSAGVGAIAGAVLLLIE